MRYADAHTQRQFELLQRGHVEPVRQSVNSSEAISDE
jgi:hypothetical protein